MLVFFTCSPTQSSLSFCISKTKHIFSFCANLCSETVDFKCLCLTHIKKGFPCGSAGKESVCNTGDLGSIPGLGRSPEEGKGYPLQYSGLENSMDCIVHGVTKSWIRLNHFHKHHSYYFGLPRWLSGKESACQCRRHRCDLISGLGWSHTPRSN